MPSNGPFRPYPPKATLMPSNGPIRSAIQTAYEIAGGLAKNEGVVPALTPAR